MSNTDYDSGFPECAGDGSGDADGFGFDECDGNGSDRSDGHDDCIGMDLAVFSSGTGGEDCFGYGTGCFDGDGDLNCFGGQENDYVPPF